MEGNVAVHDPESRLGTFFCKISVMMHTPIARIVSFEGNDSKATCWEENHITSGRILSREIEIFLFEGLS